MNNNPIIAVISESEFTKDSLKRLFEPEKIETSNLLSCNFYNFSILNKIIEPPLNFDFLIINTSYFTNSLLYDINNFIARNNFKYKCLLTNLNEIQYGTLLMELGFDAYINENLPRNLIKTVIDELMSKKLTCFFLDSTKDLFIKYTYRNNEKKISLTQKEKKIILELGNGLNSKQIGYKCGISDKTVNVHRSNIKKKLGFVTSSELINFSFTQLNFSDIHNKLFSGNNVFSSSDAQS